MARSCKGLRLAEAALVLAACWACAGQPVWNEIAGEKLLALRLKGDAARGAEVFAVCEGCHKAGAAGSPSGAYPRLAGQHATVLIEQIVDIRSGRRSNRRMQRMVHEHIVSPQDIADVAAYLQALPIPPNLGRGPGTDLARGEALYARDCARCHGSRGEGDADKFRPLLAGQHYLYLLHEARDIRDGLRGNANPDMAEAIKSYANEEIEAVADYLARLPTR